MANSGERDRQVQVVHIMVVIILTLAYWIVA